jgi:hypothetical protein
LSTVFALERHAFTRPASVLDQFRRASIERRFQATRRPAAAGRLTAGQERPRLRQTISDANSAPNFAS